VIVDNALYRAGVRVPLDCDVADLTTVRGRCAPGDFVWIGLFEPERAELDEVAKVFGLHGLAVEDAVKAHQRP
jgi:magnesium transporter